MYFPSLPPRANQRAKDAVARRVVFERRAANLGAVPAVAAAALPSVKQIASRAFNSVIGIFDPGKRRDRNREARAQMWYEFASAGSITGARRLLGGTTMQYTTKEKAMYKTRWDKFAAAMPELAAQARSLGGLGIPDPGSDQAPPSLSDEELQSLQREIDAYASRSSGEAPAGGDAVTRQAGTGIILPLAALAAFFLLRRR